MGSNKVTIIDTAEEKSRLESFLKGFSISFDVIATRLGPVSKEKSIYQAIEDLKTEISAGFDKVVEAIRETSTPPPPPAPKMKGTIMADYQIPDDQPDGRVTFNLSATDSEGQPITDPAELAKLGFDLVNSNDSAFAVTLDADQPDPTKRVGGYHVGAPGQAAVTENLKDADGNIIATGTDSFTVTTGKVALGAVKSEFEGLTPIS